jgi:hypothetical protein
MSEQYMTLGGSLDEILGGIFGGEDYEEKSSDNEPEVEGGGWFNLFDSEPDNDNKSNVNKGGIDDPSVAASSSNPPSQPPVPRQELVVEEINPNDIPQNDKNRDNFSEDIRRRLTLDTILDNRQKITEINQLLSDLILSLTEDKNLADEMIQNMNRQVSDLRTNYGELIDYIDELAQQIQLETDKDYEGSINDLITRIDLLEQTIPNLATSIDMTTANDLITNITNQLAVIRINLAAISSRVSQQSTDDDSKVSKFSIEMGKKEMSKYTNTNTQATIGGVDLGDSDIDKGFFHLSDTDNSDSEIEGGFFNLDEELDQESDQESDQDDSETKGGFADPDDIITAVSFEGGNPETTSAKELIKTIQNL